MSMAHAKEDVVHPHHHSSSSSQRPTSAQSGHSSHSSSSSSKHVKCIGRYVLTGHTLGKGNFARVEAAVHTLTRAKIAIKIIETDKIKEEYVKKNLLREAQLMRRLRHPNIIRLYETMKTNSLYCLVTEIAEGGELLSFVRNDFKERRLPEATTRPFVRQLTSALLYLHSSGIVHRDLKMENILLDKKKRHVKIVDFGLSNAQKPGALLQTHCGSPEYAAPELFIPGRQYGPEVDVWSLGVNMYAMLVGKLPFRSPRQGTKKRQKLLEQISGGITEHHEKEMAHLSTGSCDLICQLLQPDSSRRAILEEVMHHPWITKDGNQPLIPYEYAPPDPITQNAVMDLMQKVLSEPIGQIKETVRRDRCDWLASIYNLLMDQPEGRSVLQRMLTDDPSDQLTSAAEEYHATAEHLSLSQSLSQHSQHSQEHSDQSDLTGILTKPIFPNKHDVMRSKGFANPLVMVPDGDLYSEHGDYNSSTLPLTKSEKRRHHTDEHHIKGYGIHPASASHTHHYYRNHRYPADVSPRHGPNYHDLRRNSRGHHQDDSHLYGLNSQLPPTVRGNQEAVVTRPHSRLSAPEPIPLPFQKSLYYKSNYCSHHNSSQHVNESHLLLSPTGTPPPTNEGEPLGSANSKRRTGSLKPLMRKSLSTSVDTHLDAAYHGSIPWKGKAQVGPYRRPSMESIPPIGWSSQTQFNSSQRIGSVRTPADIQSLMPQDQDGSHKLVDSSNIVMRSSNSAEIKPELFMNSQNVETLGRAVGSGLNDRMTTDGLQIDLLPVDAQNTHNPLLLKKSFRSSSAKQPNHSIPTLNNQVPELSTSAKHLGEPLGPINGLKIHSSIHHPRELPNIDPLPSNKDSPSWKRKTFTGFIGKAFKKNGSGNKMDRTDTVGTSDILSDVQ